MNSSPIDLILFRFKQNQLLTSHSDDKYVQDLVSMILHWTQKKDVISFKIRFSQQKGKTNKKNGYQVIQVVTFLSPTSSWRSLH